MARLSRRLIYWVSGSLVALLVLVVAGLATAVAVIDPNDHKPRIQRLFRQATGRELTLSGQLSWRLYPWLVIDSAGGEVGNAASFDSAALPFARWQHLRLGVKLLPLLRRQLLIDRVTVEGLQVNLQRDAGGAGNWNFSTPAASASDVPESTLQVDAIRLTDASVRYQDAVSAADWRLGQLAFAASLPAGATAKDLALHDVDLQARVYGGPLAAEGVPVAFKAPRIRYQSEGGTLALPAFTAGVATARLQGAVDARVAEVTAAGGKLAVEDTSLRGTLQALGMKLPPTRDAAVIGPFQLATEFELSGDRVDTRALGIRLDDTHVTGQVTVESLAPIGIVFELAADAVDVDRYLKPEGVASDPFVLPVAQLKALNLRGVLTIREAKMAGAVVRGMRAQVDGP